MTVVGFAILQFVHFGLRVLAGLAGAFVGWMFTGYVVRFLVRLAFHRPTPRPVLTLSRLLGALAIGLLVYYYLHPGGSGGWGWGGGGGGGSGSGQGSHGGTASGKTTPDKSTRPAVEGTTQKAPGKDTLVVELLGGSRYKGEGRYYVVQGKPPARTLKEIEALLKAGKERLGKLEIVIRPDSVSRSHPATTRLQQLADEYGLATVVPGPAPPLHETKQ